MWLSWWGTHLQCGRPGFDPLFGKIWRRERLPTPVFWPGEFHGQPMGSQRVGHSWVTFTLLYFTLLWISFQHILIEYYFQQMVEIIWFICTCFWVVCFYFFLMLTKIFVLLFWILSFLGQATRKMATVEEPTCKAGDAGSIPGSGRSTGEGSGNPLQYSCLENSMDRGGWRALKSMGLQKSDMTQWLTYMHMVSIWAFVVAQW